MTGVCSCMRIVCVCITSSVKERDSEQAVSEAAASQHKREKMVKMDPDALFDLMHADLTAEGGIRNDAAALTKLSGYVFSFTSFEVTRKK